MTRRERHEIRAVWYDGDHTAVSVPLDGWRQHPDTPSRAGEPYPIDHFGIYIRDATGLLWWLNDYPTEAEARAVVMGWLEDRARLIDEAREATA